MPEHAIPDHVPTELVFDFDYATATAGRSDPHQAFMELDDRGAPDIFYTPAYGGHWIARRYRHVWQIFRDFDNFGQFPSLIPQSQGWVEPLIPVEVDPPLHTLARKALGPFLTPSAVNNLELYVREVARELVDSVADKKSCEFNAEFSRNFAPAIFLKLFGMPTDTMREFQGLVVKILSAGSTSEEQIATGERIFELINALLDKKLAHPEDDWSTKLVNLKNPDGTDMFTRRQLVNMGFLMFIAGLDTVAGTMVWTWRYLAEHPEVCDQLREHPEEIPLAIEEMLRIYTVTVNVRVARHDLEFEGIKFKAGEQVLLLVPVANRDPEQFPNAETVDLKRENNLHMAFGAGLHRCAGSNLARIEIRVAIEEWLSRIPRFRIQEGAEITGRGGIGVFISSLPLEWD